MFERELYYSQTEILKNFQVSDKKLKAFFLVHYVPVVSNLITYGNYYSITAKYRLKSDIAALMVQQGIPRR
jgi:hypothetical protein